ncbi:MAG: hypothetical protein ACE5J5_08400, partial [Candidatus Hydrothermarchaeales archaeon]
MGANDYEVIKSPGENREYRAEDWDTGGETSVLLPGEPVKVGGTGNNFATVLATGDPEAGTDEFIGVVSRQGTHTSSADGVVEVTTCVPSMTVLRAAATTVGSVDTAAELNGILGDWVAGDVTAVAGTNGTFTIDEDEASDPNVHGFKIIAGNIDTGNLDF